jgi:2-polyprenyl-3-methyl-5-hydroxy-6-metoxy-1,4-benzoquinol methylase
MTDQRPHSHGDASQQWFEEWFNHPLYLQVYSHRDSSEASLCVETILRITGLATADITATVLDIACGAGRHAIAFARKGLDVTANDLSPFLLETARSEARRHGLDIRFNRCDMRTLRLGPEFRLIVQLFSSFGYFKTDEEELQVLHNIASMLLPDGWYVLDLVNPAWLRSHFIPESQRSAGMLSILEKRSLSPDSVTKEITIRDGEGATCRFTESMRLFSKDEISGMLGKAGFSVELAAGDYRGAPFLEAESPRIILFCRKRG